jgi:hypothetical protein
MALGFMTLASTTATAAYVMLSSPSGHRQVSSPRIFQQQQQHQHDRSAIPPVLSFQKPLRPYVTCLAAAPVPNAGDDCIDSTPQQQQQHDGSKSSSTSSTSSAGRLRKTLNEMTAAIRRQLILQKLEVGAPPESRNDDSPNQELLLRSLLNNVQLLQDELDQQQPQRRVGGVVKVRDDLMEPVLDDEARLLRTQVQLAVADITQDNEFTTPFQLAQQTTLQQAQQQKQQPQLLRIRSPTAYELLEKASLKLKQKRQRRLALQLEMVALKEQYDNQIVHLQEQLQQNSTQREAFLIQQHEEEIRMMQKEHQQDRLANQRRVDQLITKGRRELLAVQTQAARLEEELVNTTMSLDRAILRRAALQDHVSRLLIRNEELQDQVVLLNSTQSNVPRLVQRLGSLVSLHTVQRVRGFTRRVLGLDRMNARRDLSSSSLSQQRQQQLKGEEDWPLSLRYQSLALKKKEPPN